MKYFSVTELVWDETNRDLVGFNVSELESVIPWKERTLSVFEFFGEYSPASVGIFNETTLILCRFDETLLHVLNTTSTVPGYIYFSPYLSGRVGEPRTSTLSQDVLS